jgi:hypothetical protein
MASGRVIDYLGSGLASARPAAPDVYSGTVALWLSTDTGVLSGWDGSTWTDFEFDSPITVPSGGFADGSLLVAFGGVLVELPPGEPGDVLEMTASLGPVWMPNPGGGDVLGPGASVDNTVPRWVGTAGDEIEDTGVVIGDNDELYGYRAQVDRVTSASYTLLATDTGRIKELADGSGVTCNLDREMPVGFAVTVMQAGAGAVNFVPESGGTLVNRQSHTETAGQYAMVTLYVSENSGGSAAVWVLGGDTA